jgi:hypothetical protein
MPRKGRTLELLVARVEAALGTAGVVVKSPDRLPDRDTGRLREVDVSLTATVGSTQVVVIVECRDRARKDDVTWIEQVAEKTRSVGAARAVAVSRKGLSEEARKKASALAVEVRTLAEIDPADLLRWFRCKEVFVGHLEVDVHLAVFATKRGGLGRTPLGQIAGDSKIIKLPASEGSCSLFDLLERAAAHLGILASPPTFGDGPQGDEEFDAGPPARRHFLIGFDPGTALEVEGRLVEVASIEFDVTFKRRARRVAYQAARTYESPRGKLSTVATAAHQTPKFIVELDVHERADGAQAVGMRVSPTGAQAPGTVTIASAE